MGVGFFLGGETNSDHSLFDATGMEVASATGRERGNGGE